MRRPLPHAGNEEVLQDGHWLGLLLTIRLQHTLCHLLRDWYGWHSPLGFLGARRLCRSARVRLRWQILVVQDLALSCQSRHPLLPFAVHLHTSGGTVDGGSGSCATECGICFTCC